jgi:uncharacterized RDD family membrane protein YckC
MPDSGPRTGAPFASTGPATPHAAGLTIAPSTEGVLGLRFFAYLIDILVIFALTALLGVVIGILGVVTLGLAWSLYLILAPATAILYSAITVGGRKQSTIGMRMVGLRVVNAASGSRVDWVTAAIHAFLFYIAASTLLLWVVDVVIGVARDDKRMGHDLVVGLMLARSR